MAYSDSTGDNLQPLRRTLAGVTDFKGRSRRTEVVYYWVASTLLAVVLNFVALGLSSEGSLLFGTALRVLLLVPMPALFVRRLHDQNRSGWWGLLLPLAVLLSIPGLLIEARGDVAEIISQRTMPASIAADLAALAVFVLFLLPATDGANRYGPDPRLE